MAVRRAGSACQTVPGKVVDAAVAALLIEMMTPMTLGGQPGGSARARGAAGQHERQNAFIYQPVTR